MRKPALVFLVAVLSLSFAAADTKSPALPAAPAGLTPGQAKALEALGLTVFSEAKAVPDFTAAMIGGGKQSLSSLKGRLVLLNFWATWCPPCRQEMPSIQRLSDRMKGRNFAVLAVDVSEGEKTVRDFLTKNGFSYPVALDENGSISGNFVGRGIPTTYLIGRDGKAIAGIIGSREWDTVEVSKILDDLVGK
jgi:thiol-disulfide isomerase/thioredoxin